MVAAVIVVAGADGAMTVVFVSRGGSFFVHVPCGGRPGITAAGIPER
jgi:hypothetical protein